MTAIALYTQNHLPSLYLHVFFTSIGIKLLDLIWSLDQQLVLLFACHRCWAMSSIGGRAFGLFVRHTCMKSHKSKNRHPYIFNYNELKKYWKIILSELSNIFIKFIAQIIRNIENARVNFYTVVFFVFISVGYSTLLHK